MDKKTERIEFPGAPALLHMFGLFGEVHLGPMGSRRIPLEHRMVTEYQRDVFFDGESIGTLYFEPTLSNTLTYEGEDPSHLRRRNLCLIYSYNKKQRMDDFEEVLFP